MDAAGCFVAYGLMEREWKGIGTQQASSEKREHDKRHYLHRQIAL